MRGTNACLVRSEPVPTHGLSSKPQPEGIERGRYQAHWAAEALRSAGGASKERSNGSAPWLTVGGTKRAHPLSHPSNGEMTWENQSPEIPARFKPDAAAIKRRRLGAKPWRAHEESTLEPERVSHTPRGGGVALAARAALIPFSSPVTARPTQAGLR